MIHNCGWFCSPGNTAGSRGIFGCYQNIRASNGWRSKTLQNTEHCSGLSHKSQLSGPKCHQCWGWETEVKVFPCSVTQTPGFPVLHHFLELAQTRCHPIISSSFVPFSCPQSFPASGSFPMSQLFTSGGQSIRASASVLPMNIQGCFPLGLTDLISLQSKGLSRVFSSTII